MSVQIVHFGADPQRVGEWADGPVPPSTLHFTGRYAA